MGVGVESSNLSGFLIDVVSQSSNVKGAHIHEYRTLKLTATAQSTFEDALLYKYSNIACIRPAEHKSWKTYENDEKALLWSGMSAITNISASPSDNTVDQASPTQ